MSDATVSAETISGVCLSSEGQQTALGGSRREDWLWEDGLMRRKEAALEEGIGKAHRARLDEVKLRFRRSEESRETRVSGCAFPRTGARK